MTRIALLADIHGNLPALRAVIADAEARGCQRFVDLGDCLSGPLWPAETADLLIARGWPTIAGNHERQLLTLGDRMSRVDVFTAARLEEQHWAWLRTLPASLAVDGMQLCHGDLTSDLGHLTDTVSPSGIAPATDREIVDRVAGATESMILCGHSHLPAVRRLPDGRTVANPGSVGLPAFDDDWPHPYVVENGDPRARYAVRDGEAITLITVDYDHQAAAAEAERAGFPQWAHWIATGRVACSTA